LTIEPIKEIGFPSILAPLITSPVLFCNLCKNLLSLLLNDKITKLPSGAFNNMVDLKLIEDCKANSKKAQIALYRKYNQGMYRIAYRLLRNVEDAEDVIQESFLNAFKKIHQFKGDVTFGAWLKKIVVNRSINQLQKNQLTLVDMDESNLAHIQSVDKNPTSHGNKVLKEVKSAISVLPEKYRYVVMLYLIEGFDHLEIAEILNISVPTSKTRLSRGKVKLKNALKQKGYGERY